MTVLILIFTPPVFTHLPKVYTLIYVIKYYLTTKILSYGTIYLRLPDMNRLGESWSVTVKNKCYTERYDFERFISLLSCKRNPAKGGFQAKGKFKGKPKLFSTP